MMIDEKKLYAVMQIDEMETEIEFSLETVFEKIRNYSQAQKDEANEMLSRILGGELDREYLKAWLACSYLFDKYGKAKISIFNDLGDEIVCSKQVEQYRQHKENFPQYYAAFRAPRYANPEIKINKKELKMPPLETSLFLAFVWKDIKSKVFGRHKNTKNL